MQILPSDSFALNCRTKYTKPIVSFNMKKNTGKKRMSSRLSFRKKISWFFSPLNGNGISKIGGDGIFIYIMIAGAMYISFGFLFLGEVNKSYRDNFPFSRYWKYAGDGTVTQVNKIRRRKSFYYQYEFQWQHTELPSTVQKGICYLHEDCFRNNERKNYKSGDHVKIVTYYGDTVLSNKCSRLGV
ncbi:MAG: hypothetical protein ACRC2T_19750 [Thermoguttaceae bacterium]